MYIFQDNPTQSAAPAPSSVLPRTFSSTLFAPLASLLTLVADLLREVGGLRQQATVAREEQARLEREKAALAEEAARATAKAQRAEEERRRLAAELAEARRAGKRAATPHSKGTRKENPKKPGRKAGQGKFTNRQEPPEGTQSGPAMSVPLCGEKRAAGCACGCTEFVFLGTETVSTTDIAPVPAPVVRVYEVEKWRCAKCDTIHRGEHPDVAPDQQGATAHRVGARAHAAMVDLHVNIGAPQRSVPRIMRKLFNLTVTQSALTQSLLKLGESPVVTTVYESLRQEVRNAPVVYTDDTSWKIGGVAAFLMGFDTDDTTFYQIRRQHRNEEVREVIGDLFRGILSTDRGSSYGAMELDGTRQNKCLCHILRNIGEARDKQPPGARQFTNELAKTFVEANDLYKEYKSGKCTLEEYHLRGQEIYNHLGWLLRPRNMRDPDNQRLINELFAQFEKERLLLFLEHPEVEPTNNRAERILRPAVIARKVSQCSKNQRGADAYARLKTIVETAKRRGMDTIEALTALIRGENPFATHGPPLLQPT